MVAHCSCDGGRQLVGQRRGQPLRQRLAGLGIELLGQAEDFEQVPGRGRADAWLER